MLQSENLFRSISHQSDLDQNDENIKQSIRGVNASSLVKVEETIPQTQTDWDTEDQTITDKKVT